MALNWRRDFLRYQRIFLDLRVFYNKRPDLKIFLEILLSLGAISIFAIFAFRPTLLTIAQLLTELKEKENTLSQLDKKITNLGVAQTLYQQKLPQVSLLGIAVPEVPTPEAIIRQAEGLANRNGVTIIGATSGEMNLYGAGKPPREDKDLKQLPANSQGFTISFSATGSYQSLVSFLSDLENMRRPIYIDSMNINAVKTDNGQRLVLTVTGRGVYEKQN